MAAVCVLHDLLYATVLHIITTTTYGKDKHILCPLSSYSKSDLHENFIFLGTYKTKQEKTEKTATTNLLIVINPLTDEELDASGSSLSVVLAIGSCKKLKGNAVHH